MVPTKKLERIEQQIYRECEFCSGDTCVKCKAKVSRIHRYAKANIPMDYWMRAFKDFKGDPQFKKIIQKHLKNMDKAYDDGQSFAFVGNLGIGKTYAACALLKMALLKGYSSQYLNMSDIIEMVQDREFKERILNVDFLVIDEFDARYVYPSEKSEQLFGQTMEKILRERFQNKMPTILCSNTVELNKVLKGDFAKALDSLFSKYLNIIYVSGKDFRKK